MREESRLADDALKGVPAIADFIGENPRTTYYLLESGQVPAFKYEGGKTWRASKTVLREHYRRLATADAA